MNKWLIKVGALALCCILVLGLAPSAFAVNAPQHEDEIIGEWIWGDTLADAGVDGTKTIINRCAEMGITDIYLLVKGTSGTIGWLKTSYTDNLSRTDRDILQEVIDLAHPHGIRVHAWVCNMEDKAYKAAHPESGMWHYVRGRDNNRINPYDEGYQAYMCSLVTELIQNYDVDGIHFDYIRYNHACNGWSDEDIANLEEMGADIDHLKAMIEATFYTGGSGDGSTIFNAYNSGDQDALILAQYRRNNVVSYAEKIIATAKALDPDIIISAALQPDGATDPAFGDIHYGQSYDDAAKLYDYICPMAYSGDFGQDAAWVKATAEAALKAGNKIVMGLQAYFPTTSGKLMEEVNVVKELEQDAQVGKNVLGYVLFRNSQFGYAKVCYDTKENQMTINVINPGGAYQWVQVDLQEGLKAISGKIVDGFAANTQVEIEENGSYVKFSGQDMLASNSEGTLQLTFEGTLNEETAPALVRIYITNESRALNIYEDVTEPDPVSPTPVYPTPTLPTIKPVVVPNSNNPFTDVTEDDWFYDAVLTAYDRGLMVGVTETRFAPNEKLTRAELLMVLYRMAGAPRAAFQSAFSDVSEGAWYAEAISWGYENGIAKGNTDGTFAPNAIVTREQMAAFLYRYQQMQGMDVSARASLSFADANQVSDYAKDAMSWAVASGILHGVKSGNATLLQPKGAATRAQLAAVITR